MKAFRNFSILSIALLCSCKADVNAPLDKGGSLAAKIIVEEVENMEGAAKITYSLPNDENLFYVKAEYVIGKDNKREEKSSAYTNSILVEGFSDTEEHEVRLYSVNKNEEKSEPVIVKVKPLIPAVKSVFETLSLETDFGGVSAYFVNSKNAKIAISILVKDALGDWKPVESLYTSQGAGSFSVRGFDAKKMTFGVFIRDRWLNHSDTLVRDITPIFEKVLDKKLFNRYDLPTDYNRPNNTTSTVERIWDGDITSNFEYMSKPSTVAGIGGIPQWFTFDLGKMSKLSRLKVFTRAANVSYAYNAGTIKTWEIWGSNDPNPDGSWESWTKLMLCEAEKPSGLPIGTISEEDKASALAGWEFTFPAGTVPVRYIRWKVLANWGNVTHVNLTEATFFGSN